MLDKFFKAEGPSRIYFYFQIPYKINEFGELVDYQGAHPELIVTDGKISNFIF
jgi:hypothetical protein